MPSIPATQARAQFTSDCVDVYRAMVVPSGFLRSFFPNVQAFTRYVSIQVQRMYEKVAVDVMRGTEGNRNNFSKSTEKVLDPPFYSENFDVTQIDLYDRLFGSTAIDAGVYSQLLQEVADKLVAIQANIERAYELQCSQALETGVITLTNQTNIDFGRQAGSLVANAAGNTWATGTVDPFATLGDGCKWIRQNGKYNGIVFNAILGSSAQADLFNNTIFKSRVSQNLNNNIDVVTSPTLKESGGTFHGQLSAGSYKVNLWTYPEYYENSSNVSTAYVNAKKCIIIPEKPRFKLAFAAVPRLLQPETGAAQMINGTENIAAPYVIGEYTDPKATAHIVEVKSAGVAIPIAIDTIYTVQPVA